MRRPTFSIVIPTAGLDRRPMLAECLASLERSIDRAGDLVATAGGDDPGAAVEIVLVLDGGRVEEYGAVVHGRNVRVLAQPHAGPAAARNLGWRATSGEVVAFVDDDIVAAPGWFGALATFFATHPEAAGAGGPVLPLAARNLVSRTVTDHGHLAHRRRADGAWLLLTANAAFRRHALASVGGFDERFRQASGEDLDLCERLLAAGHRIEVVPDAVVEHHHPTTVRGLLALARRYGAPHASPATAAHPMLRSRRAVTRVTRGIGQLKNVPAWYRVGRRSPHAPARVVAAGEALLHVLWQAEYDRAAGADGAA